ncbi:MAG TPA: metallophosphoesterase [Sandaracinaceae bacterium]
MSALRMAVFFVLVLGLTALIHFYLWQRLVRDPVWPSTLASIGTWGIGTLAASIPLAFVGSRLFPRELAAPIAWVAFVWMGAMFLFVVLLVPSELVRAGFGWLAAPDEVASPERRKLLARSIAVVVGAAGASLGALSMVNALSGPKLTRLRVSLRGLPSALRGLRIVQLTDIHVGPTIGRAFVEELVRRTNELEPDLVAITGDLVDGTVAELGDAVAPLANLRARHGVFFVTGNHEYYSGADEWIAHLRTLGIRVLRNERVTIEHDGAQLDVAGVDDWESRSFGHGPDLRKALAGKPEDRKVILLAHQPKQIDEAAALGVDLQLSGHTHGGQIVPFNYLVRLQQPYVVGLHEHGPSKLYVSPGTGYWGPPMRLGVKSEIALLELEPA